MPVTFDNARSGSTSGTALAFNITAAANATLLVFSFNNSGRSVSAMAYNTAPMTRLGLAALGECEVWGLTAPAAGANQLVVQLVGAAAPFGAIAATYTKCKSANPFGTVASATAGTVNTLKFAISSTTTDRVVAGFKVDFSTFENGNGTLRATATCGAQVRLLVIDIAGTSPVTVSATTAGTPSWAALGVSLRFSASEAGASTVPFARMLMGIGV